MVNLLSEEEIAKLRKALSYSDDSARDYIDSVVPRLLDEVEQTRKISIDIEELKRKKELYIRDSGAFIPEWVDGLEKDLDQHWAFHFCDEDDAAEKIIKVLNSVLDDFITNLENKYI